MLLVFRSRAAAEVLMFAKHAAPLLKAAGKSFVGDVPERGVITHDDLSSAIKGIEKALALEPEPDFDDDEDEHGDKVHPMSRPVSLRQRAFPLLELLRHSLKAEADVTWEPASVW